MLFCLFAVCVFIATGEFDAGHHDQRDWSAFPTADLIVNATARVLHSPSTSLDIVFAIIMYTRIYNITEFTTLFGRITLLYMRKWRGANGDTRRAHFVAHKHSMTLCITETCVCTLVQLFIVCSDLQHATWQMLTHVCVLITHTQQPRHCGVILNMHSH